MVGGRFRADRCPGDEKRPEPAGLCQTVTVWRSSSSRPPDQRMRMAGAADEATITAGLSVRVDRILGIFVPHGQ